MSCNLSDADIKIALLMTKTLDPKGTDDYVKRLITDDGSGHFIEGFNNVTDFEAAIFNSSKSKLSDDGKSITNNEIGGLEGVFNQSEVASSTPVSISQDPDNPGKYIVSVFSEPRAVDFSTIHLTTDATTNTTVASSGGPGRGLTNSTITSEQYSQISNQSGLTLGDLRSSGIVDSSFNVRSMMLGAT